MTLVKFNRGGRDLRVPSVNASLDLLNSFFDNSFWPEANGNTLPPVNISETDSIYNIELASPGKSKEDFQIDLENGILKISTEKKEETNEENKEYTRREFKHLSFTRSFTLPKEADENQVSAEYTNGILHLKIGKKEEVKQKKIVRKIEIS